MDGLSGLERSRFMVILVYRHGLKAQARAWVSGYSINEAKFHLSKRQFVVNCFHRHSDNSPGENAIGNAARRV